MKILYSLFKIFLWFNKNYYLIYDCLNLYKYCTLLNFILYNHKVEIVYHRVDSFMYKYSTLLIS